MGALLGIIVQTLMPVALDAAKKKIQAGQIQPDPHVVAVQSTLAGAVQSKTIWVALIVAVGGFLEQNQGLLSQYIGADKMGLVMMVVGVAMAFLRTLTGNTLSEKANGITDVPDAINTPPALNDQKN